MRRGISFLGLAAAVFLLAGLATASRAQTGELRVCADPNNLPFSDQDCDVVMGVPADYDLLLPTRPYYRSSYVFVSRSDRHLNITSLRDPRLRTLRIGVHL